MRNAQNMFQIQSTMPQTIMSRELLQMPAVLLRDYLSNAIIDNPFLELRYSATEETLCRASNPLNNLETFHADPSETSDAPLSLVEELCGEQCDSLCAHLRFQVSLLDLDKDTRTRLNYLVELVNEDGYFREDILEIAKELNISTHEVLRLLQIIQGFYPVGVGARTLQECLMLQIDSGNQFAHIIRRIIEEDLPDVAQHHFSTLKRKHHLSDSQLQQVIQEIQNLNPKPGLTFCAETVAHYIYHEASIYVVDSTLKLRMKSDPRTFLVFDRNYMQDIDDAEAQSYLKAKKTEAINLLNSLNMRQAILRQLLLYLIHEQRDFFFGGKSHLRPLSMKEAATALGVHPSTITRCVRDKYIETPWGVLPLRQFFQTSSGNEELSVEYAYQLILQLIDSESKSAPLSDEDISASLKKRGISISRRTVSKYRERLGIPSQRRRKMF